ncbi:choline transporter-like protein 2 isoform X1 [Rhynchophorus ferrugineus]|uniref:choline transporter-like protein 2 isoform X1 n=2 Tax=Rhynchophorus ferrugineus TaxID=354439 RepID=UPI003FCED7F1
MLRLTQSIVPNIPVPTHKRRITNIIWLFLLGGAVAILLPPLIYCLINIRGSKFMKDSCGNICGQTNSKTGSSCSGKNMTDKPYVQTDGNTTECVAYCMFWNEKDCIAGIHVERSTEKITDQSDSDSIIWKIFFCASITILISMLLLMLLRYAAGCLVWSLIFMSLATVLAGVVVSWIFLRIIYVNIILTIVALCLCLLVYFWSSKISLLVMLINEAGKFIFDIPTLMALPVVVFLLLYLLIAAFSVVTIKLTDYGRLANSHPKIYNSVSMKLVNFTGVFNGFTILWVGIFLAGINVMVISGTVSQWYFKRNNKRLRHPLIVSIVNTFRYHLGNIALGSLIYMPMLLLKAMFMLLNKWIKRACCCDCVKFLERLVRLFIRNSYILTGIYGDPFLESGRKAINILIENLENVLSIYFIGNYVFALIQIMTIVLIMALSAAVAVIMPPEDNKSMTYAFYTISGIIAFIGSSITLNVVRVAVDTLLICYLEDIKVNQKYSKPLLASTNLHQFMEKSKAL